MLAVVTNIPTPYRTAFFNVLQQELQVVGEHLHVIYCAKTEPGRHWDFIPVENNYAFTFLKGWHPEFKGFYPHFNIGLITTLKKLKPNWIMAAGSWNAPATVSLLLHKKKLGCPIIFWSEGHFDAQVRQNKYVDYLRKSILNSLDYFVVPNPKSKEYILHYNANATIDYLPNTVDEHFFSLTSLPSKHEMRTLLKLPQDKTILVLVSSLDTRKGVLDFYEAFKKSNSPSLYAIQIGTGEFYDTLSNRSSMDSMSAKYQLTGQLNSKQVRDFLIAADVFVLPTKSDPNPLSPIEASFLKKALLLSSKAGNANDLIPNQENGWIIPEITENELIKKIEKIAATPREQLEQMGEISYEIAAASFTRKSASQQLLGFLKQIKR